MSPRNSASHVTFPRGPFYSDFSYQYFSQSDGGAKPVRKTPSNSANLLSPHATPTHSSSGSLMDFSPTTLATSTISTPTLTSSSCSPPVQHASTLAERRPVILTNGLDADDEKERKGRDRSNSRRGSAARDGSSGDGAVLSALSSSSLMRGDGSDVSSEFMEGCLLHKSIGTVWRFSRFFFSPPR